MKNGMRRINPIEFSRGSKRDIQRYLCHDCGRFFSRRREKRRRYSFTFELEITRMHVEERMSYRVMSKRIMERCFFRLKTEHFSA